MTAPRYPGSDQGGSKVLVGEVSEVVGSVEAATRTNSRRHFAPETRRAEIARRDPEATRDVENARTTPWVAQRVVMVDDGPVDRRTVTRAEMCVARGPTRGTRFSDIRGHVWKVLGPPCVLPSSCVKRHYIGSLEMPGKVGGWDSAIRDSGFVKFRLNTPTRGHVRCASRRSLSPVRFKISCNETSASKDYHEDSHQDYHVSRARFFERFEPFFPPAPFLAFEE